MYFSYEHELVDFFVDSSRQSHKMAAGKKHSTWCLDNIYAGVFLMQRLAFSPFNMCCVCVLIYSRFSTTFIRIECTMHVICSKCRSSETIYIANENTNKNQERFHGFQRHSKSDRDVTIKYIFFANIHKKKRMNILFFSFTLDFRPFRDAGMLPMLDPLWPKHYHPVGPEAK